MRLYCVARSCSNSSPRFYSCLRWRQGKHVPKMADTKSQSGPEEDIPSPEAHRTSVWNVGARYGWILTRPYGRAFLMAASNTRWMSSLFSVFQEQCVASTAYGAGFNPFNLKWDFATRGNFVPYFELSGGVLFTNHDVPAGTNSVNFTPSAAMGTHLLGEKYNWSWNSAICTFPMRAWQCRIQD